jgi:hypothetical protein
MLGQRTGRIILEHTEIGVLLPIYLGDERMLLGHGARGSRSCGSCGVSVEHCSIDSHLAGAYGRSLIFAHARDEKRGNAGPDVRKAAARMVVAANTANGKATEARAALRAAKAKWVSFGLPKPKRFQHPPACLDIRRYLGCGTKVYTIKMARSTAPQPLARCGHAARGDLRERATAVRTNLSQVGFGFESLNLRNMFRSGNIGDL